MYVLIVEDDFRVAELHAGYVRQVDGFAVAGVARSCAETIRRLTTVGGPAVDLLLVDNYLPDGSGIELLANPAIRQSGADAILVTADDTGRSVVRARRLGALNFLVKPFEPGQLAEQLVAYRQYRSLLDREHCDQARIDRAFKTLYEGNRSSPGRTQPSLTAGRIVELLQHADEDLSAQQVAERTGVARATAQRYLAQLVEDGAAEVFLRYGSTGRPEHRYRRRGAG